MQEILPGLWLGSVRATNDKAMMERIGVTHILSLGIRPSETPDTAVALKFFDIEDSGPSDILSILPEAVDFIT